MDRANRFQHFCKWWEWKTDDIECRYGAPGMLVWITVWIGAACLVATGTLVFFLALMLPEESKPACANGTQAVQVESQEQTTIFLGGKVPMPVTTVRRVWVCVP